MTDSAPATCRRACEAKRPGSPNRTSFELRPRHRVYVMPNGQAAPAQKYKCNPSWIVLLFRAVRLICPKFPTVGSAFGSANSG